jgi:Fe-S-cluster containining protein
MAAMHGEMRQLEECGLALRAALVARLAGGRELATLEGMLTACATAVEDACADRPCDCGPGCPHCCALNVAVLMPEALVIAAWLRERLAPPVLAELHRRLVAHCSRVRWVDDEERIFKQIRCPLLDSAGSCIIHPVRPLMCRAAASLDRHDCRQAFRPTLTDEARQVPADLLRQAACAAAFTALAEALRYHGLDDRSIELGAGVLAFLERPGGKGFLSGGRLPPDWWNA